ncbi:transmembrane protein 177-like [Acanthaster planci]|uniref:Transmembrane protein 177-like n=1 Tax=Acanthaster planci TaxID=133434 RepID=A0A8B7XGA0_ACAPL|nr:transmembrane protein 177-like [Acanthaster planci]XP_022079814.1 transmembrane protein 177-like [Acanthaster planci]XP_022079815.1 transmembrane protein 177-like [Acanthaster planci]XP_022079816.1 transmembrane protein 177-like [Acanthaster planci]
MVFQGFLQFIRRPRNVVIFSGAVATGVFCIKLAPHAFPSKVYRPLVEAYKGGHKIAPTESQLSEFHKVCQDIGVNPGSYSVFVTSRWEIRSRGLAWLPNGVQFGIPAILKDNPDLSAKRFSDPIKTTADSEEGRAFRNSLNLSESARKFSLAREVIKIKRNATASSVVLAPVVTLANFAGVFAAQVLFPLPLYANVALVGTCFVMIYQFLMGVVNEREDLITDDKVAELGEEYVRGGVEFYEKKIQKNIALRKIMGRRGEQMYTYYGNEVPGWIYSAGASNTQERDRLKKRLEEMERKGAPS